MNISQNAANQFKQFYFGGNWTFVNLKDTLADVDYKMALERVGAFNTIATLVFHINYYVTGVSDVLKGSELKIKDKFSFDHPPIHSQEDWEKFLQQVWTDGEEFISLVETFDISKINDNLDKPVYGSFYRNFSGIIEHGHYHLGQIVILKKWITELRTKK